MKIYLTFITTLFYIGVVSSYKCDEKIIEFIKKLWEKHTDSRNGLLKELDKSRCAVVVAATTGLLQDEDSIDHMVARFNGSSVQNVHYYKNGTTITFPNFQVEDVNGMDFHTGDQHRHRYYLPYDKRKAVAGFYMCEDTGVFGDPRGNIVAFSENYDKDVVTDVKKSLASIGITITKTYPDTFPSLT